MAPPTYYTDVGTDRALLYDQIEALTKSRVNQSIEKLANTNTFMTILKVGTGVLITGIGISILTQACGDVFGWNNKCCVVQQQHQQQQQPTTTIVREVVRETVADAAASTNATTPPPK